jgi:hypothetical protein
VIGHWYGAGRADGPHFEPLKTPHLVLVGEATEAVRTPWSEGEGEHEVRHHEFTMRMPSGRIAVEDPVPLTFFHPHCVAHERRPEWLDLVQPGRLVEVEVMSQDVPHVLDAAGHVRRPDEAVFALGVRVFMPDGAER